MKKRMICLFTVICLVLQVLCSCTVKEKDADDDPVNRVCAHEHTEIRNQVLPTVTETGFSGDVWCTDCNTKISDGQSLAKIEAVEEKYLLSATKEGKILESVFDFLSDSESKHLDFSFENNDGETEMAISVSADLISEDGEYQLFVDVGYTGGGEEATAYFLYRNGICYILSDGDLETVPVSDLLNSIVKDFLATSLDSMQETFVGYYQLRTEAAFAEESVSGPLDAFLEQFGLQPTIEELFQKMDAIETLYVSLEEFLHGEKTDGLEKLSDKTSGECFADLLNFLFQVESGPYVIDFNDLFTKMTALFETVCDFLDMPLSQSMFPLVAGTLAKVDSTILDWDSFRTWAETHFTGDTLVESAFSDVLNLLIASGVDVDDLSDLLDGFLMQSGAPEETSVFDVIQPYYSYTLDAFFAESFDIPDFDAAFKQVLDMVETSSLVDLMNDASVASSLSQARDTIAQVQSAYSISGGVLLSLTENYRLDTFTFALSLTETETNKGFSLSLALTAGTGALPELPEGLR